MEPSDDTGNWAFEINVDTVQFIIDKAEYLIGTPLLADYLTEALNQLGLDEK